MSKDKGQKKKDREKKVAQKKIAVAEQRLASSKGAEQPKTTPSARPNALTKGVGGSKTGPGANVTKQFSHRRMGGGG